MLLIGAIFALLVLLPGLAKNVTNTVQCLSNAAQTTERRPSESTLLAVNSSYASVHHQDINAYVGSLIIGKQTAVS